MTLPSLNVAAQGISQTSADNLNTFVQSANIVTDLRAFIGLSGMKVHMTGFTAPNDGGQGFFYWNASGTGPDDGGVTNIVPTGTVIGCWTRIVATDNNTFTLIGDVTGSGSGTITTTVAILAGVPFNSATGTGSVVFSNAPTFTGVVNGDSQFLSGLSTAAAFVPFSATIPSNGVYLSSANTVGISSNSALCASFSSTGSPVVNGINFLSRATGGAPNITAIGSDPIIGLVFVSKAGGSLSFQTGSGEQFTVNDTPSVANRYRITGGSAGNPPNLFINGSDTDIDALVTPKNAGLFRLGNAASFTANGTATITVSSLGPAAITTATIKKWLTIKDISGTTLYIPAWGA